MQKQTYLVADYFLDFKCKCGNCRSTCYVGWPVTLSYAEYCRLLGLKCKSSLRRRLDTAFYLADYPPEARYAKMNPNWLNDCPLHDKDGFCALHKECGETVLPEICKMYPRNIEVGRLLQATCANSCEAVLETLFAREDKLTFKNAELAVSSQNNRVAALSAEKTKMFLYLQSEAIKILQNRTMSLNDRFEMLGKFSIDAQRDNNIETDFIDLVEDFEKQPYKKTTFESSLTKSLDVVLKLVKIIDEFSPNFKKFAEIAAENLEAFETENSDCAATERAADIYKRDLKHFETVLPKWEIYFEHIMVNHLFFEKYPLSGVGDFWDEFSVFCAFYALTKFVSVGYMAHFDTLDAFVDCIAGVFRCLEHSNANQVVLKTLKLLNAATPEALAELVSI